MSVLNHCLIIINVTKLSGVRNVTLLAVLTRQARPNLVSFGGIVKGESAMKTEEEIGSLINFTFRVSSVQPRP